MSPITPLPSVQCKHFSISCSASTANPEYLPPCTLSPCVCLYVCIDRSYPRKPSYAGI